VIGLLIFGEAMPLKGSGVLETLSAIERCRKKSIGAKDDEEDGELNAKNEIYAKKSSVAELLAGG